MRIRGRVTGSMKSEPDRTRRKLAKPPKQRVLKRPPNLMFPAFKPARVDTILLVCPGRLSWRHRARPSATLHETQACPLGANLNDFFVPQGEIGRKADCSEWCIPVPQRSWKAGGPHVPSAEERGDEASAAFRATAREYILRRELRLITEI